MNRDEESLISAYLDDELSPSGRLQVESALLDDPRLADRLQELSSVRVLVSGLPRPTVDRDLSGAVLGKIDALPGVRARRLVRDTARSPRSWVLASGLVAAAVVGAFFVPRWSANIPPEGRKGSGVAVVPPKAPSAVPRAVPNLAARNVDPRREASPSAIHRASSGIRYASPPSLLELKTGQDHEALTRVLGAPGLRQITLIVDNLGPETLDDVENAIRQTRRTHPFQARLRVAQGVLIDPKHPEEAVVYAVVLTDSERQDFRHRLEAQLDASPSEGEPVPPEVATRLADVGSFEVADAPGRSPADDPMLAHRAEPVEPGSGVVLDVPDAESVGSPLSVPHATGPPGPGRNGAWLGIGRRRPPSGIGLGSSWSGSRHDGRADRRMTTMAA